MTRTIQEEKSTAKLDPTTACLEEFIDPAAEIAAIHAQRLRAIETVDQDLVLVSQVQRSGGTLVTQMFDGHPELHVHPTELYIGRPNKWDWPRLDLDGRPEDWFAALFEPYTNRGLREGYSKQPLKRRSETERYECLMLPSLMRAIFLELASARSPKSQREILNWHMTTYFNGWLGYPLSGSRRRLVFAFVPRLISHAESVVGYFKDYPGGRLISLVRDPVSWYASAHALNRVTYPDPVSAAEHWIASTNGMLREKEQRADRVRLVKFEHLIERPEHEARRLCEFLGIGFDPMVLTPTYMGRPIAASSSFRLDGHGVLKDPADRRRQVSEKDTAAIVALTSALYADAVEAVESQD